MDHDTALKQAAELITPSPDSKFQGVMVAWWPDPEFAKQLAKYGDIPPEEIHLTIAYFGKSDPMSDQDLAGFITGLSEKLIECQPLAGNINGWGVFNPSESSDNKPVLYAAADVPGLDELRHKIVKCAKDCGVELPTEHGYSPHITLSYALPENTNIPTIPLNITAVTLSVGDKKLNFPLLGMAESEHGDYAMSDNGLFVAENGGHYRLFNDLPNITGQGEEWITYLPAPGVWKHPTYGVIRITPERNARFADHFNKGIYQKTIPIDAEHQTKLSGALAAIKQMKIAPNGAVLALVEWNGRGAAMIADKRFRHFSPEFYDKWEDPVTNVVYQDVPIGGALTTRPFFKEGSLPPVIASEGGFLTCSEDLEQFQKETTTMSDENANQFAELSAKFAESEAKRVASETEAKQLAEQAKTMAEKIAKMEGEAQERRFTETINGAGAGPKWFGETTAHLSIMAALGEGSELYEAYCKQQRAFAEQMKTSNLFSEVGTSAGGVVTAEAKLNAEAQKIFNESAGKLTYHEAYTQALERNPALYAQHEQEKGGN